MKKLVRTKTNRQDISSRDKKNDKKLENFLGLDADSPCLCHLASENRLLA